MTRARRGLQQSGKGSILGDGGTQNPSRNKAILYVASLSCFCRHLRVDAKMYMGTREDLEELGHKNTGYQDLPKPENLQRPSSGWHCPGVQGNTDE